MLAQFISQIKLLSRLFSLRGTAPTKARLNFSTPTYLSSHNIKMYKILPLVICNMYTGYIYIYIVHMQFDICGKITNKFKDVSFVGHDFLFATNKRKSGFTEPCI
jgi:hypothetical protein